MAKEETEDTTGCQEKGGAFVRLQVIKVIAKHNVKAPWGSRWYSGGEVD